MPPYHPPFVILTKVRIQGCWLRRLWLWILTFVRMTGRRKAVVSRVRMTGEGASCVGFRSSGR